MNCLEARALIDAYADGELGVERSLELEAHLATCPSCQAELESRRALGKVMRERLEYHAAPLALHQAIREELAQEAVVAFPGRTSRRQAPREWLRIAASLVLVAGLSSALTYYYTGPNGSAATADEVFASHVRAMQSDNRLIDVVSTDQHTVKPWLDARLDFGVPVKDLTAYGFALVGGRVDYIGGRTVAALIYHYQKHVLTLFIWPSEGSARPIRTSVHRGENIAEWSDGSMTYWAISDVASGAFREFCDRFQATEPSPEPGAAATKP
ncbi:MAG TPA: anti-sigma factor [Alphaproteobacteria bacterium]|nr:anti-sigma factor [Alphaproteobacteria bacterium]